MNRAKKQILNQIRERHGLEFILLHGSRVAGKLHDKSDIDLAVLSKEGTDFDLLKLIADFAQIYNADQIDITNLTHANPLLLYSVAKKSTLLSGDTRDFEDFRFRAYKKYGDYLPFLKMEEDFVKESFGKYNS